MTDKGSYTLSSGDAAKAELRELREVAVELADTLGEMHEDFGKPSPRRIAKKRRASAILARYEALRDG